MSLTTFSEFVEITKRLRKECPWDREQTHSSIRNSLIEEAYEVVEAIDTENSDALREELGDILLHVVFHSNIAEESSEFTLGEVIDGISKKLIRRHPHVFGELRVEGADDVKKNWERLKLEEGRESLLDGVPAEMPSLLRAHRISEKASKAGFDWAKAEEVRMKILEELAELEEAVGEGDPARMESEFGDLLFAVVNYARFLRVNPEKALGGTVDKFRKRFQFMEQRLREQGKDIYTSTPGEMDALWNEAKKT